MAIPAALGRNLALPVIGAPMFLVSNPELVIAQCRSGIIGAFPALNARPEAQLNDWLRQIGEALAGDAAAAPSPSTRSFTNRMRGWSTTWRCACSTRCH